MNHELLIDTLHCINTIGEFNSVEKYWGSFNIGDNHSKSVQYSSKEDDTLCVQLIKFDFCRYLDCKGGYFNGFDESFASLDRWVFFTPSVDFPLE